jgi:hypothetical protein
MNIYPKLIINLRHFTIINSNVPCCTYNFFCWINDNLMCTFYNFLSNIITLMLLGMCLIFRNWNKTLWLQSRWQANLVAKVKKKITNCKYFFFLFPTKSFVTTICSIVSLSQLEKRHSFLSCCDSGWKWVKKPYNIIW